MCNCSIDVNFGRESESCAGGWECGGHLPRGLGLVVGLRRLGGGRGSNFGSAVLVLGLFLLAGVLGLPAGAAEPRAQVVVVQNPDAIDAFRANGPVIRAMVDEAITNLTCQGTVAAAWRSLVFTNGTLPSNELIGLKVFSTPGPNSGTRPAVVAGVIEGLLAAGVPRRQLIIWDRHITDLRLAGYSDLADRYGIELAGSAEAGYDEKAFYDTALIGNLVWGDLEFGQKGASVGRKSFVSKLVSRRLTKIINITPMLNHNFASVSGNLYGLALGSVDNIIRFESDAERLANAVPEIYALPELADRVVLNIVDGLLCQYEGEERALLHYSATLNELRFSRDPVALDVLSLQELERQRLAVHLAPSKQNLELYSNAALLELGVCDPKKIDIVTLKHSAAKGQEKTRTDTLARGLKGETLKR